MVIITVVSAVKYSFVSKGIQSWRTDQLGVELTLPPRSHVKRLITVKTAMRQIGVSRIIALGMRF